MRSFDVILWDIPISVTYHHTGVPQVAMICMVFVSKNVLVHCNIKLQHMEVQYIYNNVNLYCSYDIFDSLPHYAPHCCFSDDGTTLYSGHQHPVFLWTTHLSLQRSWRRWYPQTCLSVTGLSPRWIHRQHGLKYSGQNK